MGTAIAEVPGGPKQDREKHNENFENPKAACPLVQPDGLYPKEREAKEKCINCGTCVEKCPAGAIDLSNYKVDTEACVLCFGCINNCPAGAVHMKYNGEKVIGYHDFMKLKELKIIEPE